ncbi:MAG: histidinol-phosphate transaminase [Candidatus Lokiarchaeota archaeon]|nr:histidinol-phosphate transaminase [Candidatus Lokiarchaeota archaeon]
MNLKDLKRKTLDKYTPYTYGEQPDPKQNWVKLNTNENPHPPPASVLTDIKSAVNEKLRLYPDPTCKELRKLLTNVFFPEYRNFISPQNFLVANGSDEILDVLFKSFVDPGDKVVVFNPSYGMYPVLAEIYGGEVVTIDLDENFKITDEAYSASGKIMIICSPNNPTGNSTPNNVIAKICDKFDGLVLVDEAYSTFNKISAVELLEKYKNLAVMQTFSKAYAFASQRIGYMIASKEIIKYMTGIKLPYNVTYLSQQSAIAVLNNILDYQPLIENIINERDRLSKILRGFEIKVYKSDSNFILIEFPDASNAMKIFWELKDKKILVRKYNKKGLYQFLRISVGTKEQNDKFLHEFAQLAKKYLKSRT